MILSAPYPARFCGSKVSLQHNFSHLPDNLAGRVGSFWVLRVSPSAGHGEYISSWV